jgi:hypothetical protein
MLLPVTHALYMAMALVCTGVGLALFADDPERQRLARACAFSGLALAATAFARFWGSNTGLALAIFALLVSLLFALAPQPTDDRQVSE